VRAPVRAHRLEKCRFAGCFDPRWGHSAAVVWIVLGGV
jgi:hypothetical protein